MQSYRRAIEILRPLAEKNPPDATARRTLSEAREKLEEPACRFSAAVRSRVPREGRRPGAPPAQFLAPKFSRPFRPRFFRIHFLKTKNFQDKNGIPMDITLFKNRSLIAAALSIASALPAAAATFVVTNAHDNGAGSLRAAMEQANANGEADTITFDAAFFSQPRTISLTSGEIIMTKDGGTQGYPRP